MIGNNACGTHSVMAGKTEENVLELDVLTYDGLRTRASGQTVPMTNATASRRPEGGAARSTAGLEQIADRHGDEIRTRFPNIHEGCPAIICQTFCPRMDSTWPGRSSVPSALAPSPAGGDCGAGPEPRPDVLWWFSGYPNMFRCRGPCPEILDLQADRLRGHRRASSSRT